MSTDILTMAKKNLQGPRSKLEIGGHRYWLDIGGGGGAQDSFSY